MKKNGFISISVVYSFFFVFLLLLLFIVNNLISNRTMLNNIKDAVRNDIADTNFARFLINNYEELGLIYHDESLPTGALDNSYRYAGSNVNNYVCLKDTCNNNDLYRIIGVIEGKVKLVKETSINYNYDTAAGIYGNSWIYNYLNDTYYNTLNELEKNMIEDYSYYSGGFSDDYKNYKIHEIADKEFENKGVFVTNKIGLMYVSDFSYMGDSNTYDDTVKKNNSWINLPANGIWTISRNTKYYNQAFYITNGGLLDSATVTENKGIYPVFFLKNSVRLLSGSGSSTDPYKVG